MKKFCEFVFLIIPFLFLSTSCMNVLNERPSQDVTFSINQEVCEQISRDLSNADSTSENVSITCLLFDKDMKQITSKTINTSLENLSTADIKLSKIPVGRNYKLELLISYNGNLIYSGKSTEPVDINSGGVIRAKIELSRAISTIAYELNGGTKGSGEYAKEYFINSNISFPTPEYTGHAFGGWYTTSSFDGKPIEHLGKGNFLGNVTLYARWYETSCVVTYETRTNDVVPPQPVDLDYALQKKDLPVLTFPGKKFRGWFFNNQEIKEGFKVTKSIKLVAMWVDEGKVGNVIFSPQQGSYDVDQKITLIGTDEGAGIYYTLDGSDPKTSSTAKEYTTPFILADNKESSVFNISAYAKKEGLISSEVTSSNYNLKRYSVKFNSEHGKVPENKEGLVKGTVITLDELTDEGYTFNGWTDNTLKTHKDSYTVNDNVTLVANWNADTYKVTYINCDSQVINKNPENVTVKDSFNLSDPYKEGYTFNGWFTDAKFTESSRQTAISNVNGPVTLYAKFTPIVYNITYSLNGGLLQDSAAAPSTYDVNKEVLLPVPTRNEYTFGGWFTDKEVTSGRLKDNKINKGTTGDITVYAKWTENGRVSDVVITGPDNSMVDASGTSITLSCDTPGSKIYYTLNGDIPTTSSALYSSPFKISQETTVKAIAVHSELKQSNIIVKDYKLNKYKVIFISDFGIIPTQTLPQGSKVTAPDPSLLVGPGYKFGGWMKGQNPDTLWDFGTDTVPNNDVILTALWTPISYQVKFDATGIGGTENTQTYNYEEEFIIPSFNLEGPGYSIYWSNLDVVDPGTGIYHVGDIASGLCETENGVVTLTAEKDPISYTLSYNINMNMLVEVATPPSGEFGPKTIYYSDTETTTLPSYSLYYERNSPEQSYKPLNKWQTSDGRIFNEGETVKNNLLSSSGEIILTPMWTKGFSPVTDVTATAQDKDIVLSWTNPDEPDIRQVNITSEPSITIESVKVTPNEKSSVTIKNLKYGQKYTFTLTLEDKFGNTVPDTYKASAIPMRPLTNEPRILNSNEYSSPYKMEGNWEYIAFGDWPQSEKEADIVLSDQMISLQGRWDSCFPGSDGYYYYKVTLGSKIAYLKIEPIIWRVVDKNYNGNKLLVAENAITTNMPFFRTSSTAPGDRSIEGKTVVDNNYKYSNIRAYLNSLDGTTYGSKDHTTVGFLATAFTSEQQKLILDTYVDNSAVSTYPSTVIDSAQLNNTYACEDTTDKVFLLSTRELSNSDYGFVTKDNIKRQSSGFANIQKPTVDEVSGKYISYWTRSPSPDNKTNVNIIDTTGSNASDVSSGTKICVVPSLVIKGDGVDKTPPSEVRNLTATPNEDGTGIVLAWDNPTNSDFDAVTVSYIDKNGSSNEVSGIASKATTHTVTGLTKGTVYTFTVKTKDTSSNVSKGITIKGLISSEVTNIDFVPTENSIKLTWTNPNDADFTKVNITCDTKTIDPIVGTPGQEGTYTITGLDKATAYNISISTEYTGGIKSKGTTLNLKPLQGISLQGPSINVTTPSQLPQTYDFGVYPQTIKDNAVTLSTSTTKILNWTCKYGSDGNYYVEGTPESGCTGKEFSNGTPMESGKTYYFKLEPITWKFSSYTTSNGGAMYYTEKLIYNSQWGDASTHTDYRKSLVNINLNSEFANNACSKDMLYNLLKDPSLKNILDKPEYFWLMHNGDYGSANRGFSSDLDRDAPATDYAFLQDTYGQGSTVNDVVQGTRDGNSSGVGAISITGAVSSSLTSPIDGVYPFRVATFFKMNTTPTIKAFTVPKAGKSKAGTTMTFNVYGTNFKLGATPTVSTTGTGINPTVKALTNNILQVSLTIPSEPGSYDVTVAKGSVNQSATLKVTDYSTWNLAKGDIFLKDGTYGSPKGVPVVDYDKFQAQIHKTLAVGVFYGYYNKYGAPLGVSITQKELAQLSWANTGTFGYNTKFESTVCTPSSETVTSDKVTYTGDIDGYDNFEQIVSEYCKDIDDWSEAQALEELPLFKAAKDCGINLPGEFSQGWYVPSIKELGELYASTQDSASPEMTYVLATMLGGTRLNSDFWSSSQCANNPNSCWYVPFDTGLAKPNDKLTVQNTMCVRCIRAF